jgi:hypothetical protein
MADSRAGILHKIDIIYRVILKTGDLVHFLP